MWGNREVAFRIVESDETTIVLEAYLGESCVEIVTNVTLAADCLVLYDFHIDGPGAQALGLSQVRSLVHTAMEEYDVAELEIHGFERTTGANPGRKPGVVRFRRR